jgi:hypothetical protein
MFVGMNLLQDQKYLGCIYDYNSLVSIELLVAKNSKFRPLSGHENPQSKSISRNLSVGRVIQLYLLASYQDPELAFYVKYAQIPA